MAVLVERVLAAAFGVVFVQLAGIQSAGHREQVIVIAVIVVAFGADGRVARGAGGRLAPLAIARTTRASASAPSPRPTALAVFARCFARLALATFFTGRFGAFVVAKFVARLTTARSVVVAFAVGTLRAFATFCLRAIFTVSGSITARPAAAASASPPSAHGSLSVLADRLRAFNVAILDQLRLNDFRFLVGDKLVALVAVARITVARIAVSHIAIARVAIPHVAVAHFALRSLGPFATALRRFRRALASFRARLGRSVKGRLECRTAARLRRFLGDRFGLGVCGRRWGDRLRRGNGLGGCRRRLGHWRR